MFLNTILGSALDMVFPSKCIVCNKTGSLLCLECLGESRAAERESASWIFPLYDYRHPAIKKSLWFLKYRGKKTLARIFAENIYDKIMEELSDLSLLENFNDPVLIPIPLSPKRHRERGFNQSELICRELIKINDLRLPAQAGHGVDMQLEKNILIKPKETEHQARIKDRQARLKNIVGSFAIKNIEKNINLIKKRNIILIDDITTTGATLNEARKILSQAGARKVIAFTVAH
jgi:competence protein ComFC